MSTSELRLPWYERFGDRLNPILIKETRQSLKSRSFVGTFLLVLVASWLISMFGILFTDPATIEFGSTGSMFFYAYYVVLAFAILVVVPFSAYRGLLSERDQFTFEVLSISSLTPFQIVAGKLQSAMVQTFLFYSAIAPFMAFTILLKGIDGVTIAFVLGVSLIMSMGLSLIALTISTLANQRHMQSLLTIITLLGTIWMLFMALGYAGTVLAGAFAFDTSEFWWGMLVTLTYVVAYFVLLMQIAIAQLTFAADNRSTGVRLAVSAIFWLSVGWILVEKNFHSSGGSHGLVEIWSVQMGLHLGCLGLAIVAEPDQMSSRVGRGVRRFGRLSWLVTPCMPGGARGFMFILLHLLGLWLIAGFLLLLENRLLTGSAAPGVGLPSLGSGILSGYSTDFAWVTGMCLYLVIYLSVVTAVARWGFTHLRDFRASHARVTVFTGAAVLIVIPMVMDALSGGRSDLVHFFEILNPFSVLSNLATNSTEATLQLAILLLGAAAGVFFNLRAMFRGVAEVAREGKPRKVQAQTAPGAGPPAADAAAADILPIGPEFTLPGNTETE